MKGIQSSITITWMCLDSGGEQRRWPITVFQVDSAARLRIDGCGRGSDPHSCPLGPDTVAVIHSHPSANASPLLPPPPHRVPLIAGSLSSCQHTCIWEDNFTNGSVNYKKEEIKKQARFFHTSDSSILSEYCEEHFSRCANNFVKSVCAGCCWSPQHT